MKFVHMQHKFKLNFDHWINLTNFDSDNVSHARSFVEIVEFRPFEELVEIRPHEKKIKLNLDHLLKHKLGNFFTLNSDYLIDLLNFDHLINLLDIDHLKIFVQIESRPFGLFLYMIYTYIDTM